MLLDGEREEIDLVLLDGEREEIDLLQGLDLAVLHQAAKLGHRDPFLLLLAPATSPAAVSTAPAPVAAAPASPASVSESSTEATTITGWSCVRHVSCRSESSNKSLVVLDPLPLSPNPP